MRLALILIVAVSAFGQLRNQPSQGNHNRLIRSGMVAGWYLPQTNLLKYSGDLTNAIWVHSAGVSATDYETINVTDSGGSYFKQQVTVSGSTSYTASFLAKSGTLSHVQYCVYDNTHGADIISITDYSSLINGSTFTLISVPFTTPAGATAISIYLERDTPSTGTVFVTQVQVNAGPLPLPYQATTDLSTATDLSGNVVPQNLVTWSEDLTQAAWTTGASDVAAGYTNAYGGAAFKVTPNTATSTHYMRNAVTLVSSVGTVSVELYPSGYNYATLGNDANAWVHFNISTCAVDSTLGSGWASATASPVGAAGWCRITATSNSVTWGTILVYPLDHHVASGNSSPSFTGDGTSGILLSRAQLNSGTSPGIYSKTTATANSGLPNTLTKAAGAAAPTSTSTGWQHSGSQYSTAALALSQPDTICAVVYSTTMANDYFYWDGTGGSSLRQTLYWDSADSRLVFYAGYQPVTTLTPLVNTWHVGCGIFAGAQGAGYLNITADKALNLNTQALNGIILGARYSLDTALHGTVATVYSYSVALTPAQVAHNYRAQKWLLAQSPSLVVLP